MELITRHLIKAFDIGVNDNLYGGRMLDWIDEAGAMFARLSFPKNQFVTLKIAETVFHKPIHINEIIEFYVSQVTVGETSLTFTIEVKRNEELILHTTVVFVAVGTDGHSTKIIKNDYLIIHPINAEDFVQIILYLTKMQTKYWKLPFAKVIPSCIDQLNYIRNNLYKNIIVYNDIRVVKDELIVPIAYSTESEIISASFATLILSTTLWKKFYKLHKKQIDDGIYEEFEKEEE